MRIGIVGAGASGIASAIMAAEEGAEVTLFERNDRVGKKILMTGNGKCNFGNYDLSADCYYCADYNRLEAFLRRFGTDDTIHFFRSLGLVVTDRDGYLYPYSGQASSVLDALRHEVNRLGITVISGAYVKDVIAKSDELTVVYSTETNQNQKMKFDRVILSTGGAAAPVSGSDGNGCELLRRKGISVVKPLPALTALKCGEKWFSSVAGVRTPAKITLLINGEPFAYSTGELQLTDYGISGIPVFQISRQAIRLLDEGNTVSAEIDFFPMIDDTQWTVFMDSRKLLFEDRTVENYFSGILNKKIVLCLLKLAGLKADMQMEDVLAQSPERISRFWELCRKLKANVTGYNPFTQAQTNSGGVNLSEVTDNLELVKLPGVYVTGELLDIDGICGGYNLQWAWTSAYIAAKASCGTSASKGKL